VFSVFVSAGSSGNFNGTINQVSTTSLFTSGGVLGATDIQTSATTAQTAVNTIKTAISNLGTSQTSIGTLQNRVQFAVSLAQSQSVNTKAAESRIRDANVAEESANMMRYNILTQSGIAALSQANSSSSAVLALLR
jgi:flagellin